MNQQVVFEVAPTPNPDEAVGHARYVVNASSGIGMDILQQIVEEHVPAVDNPETYTTKKIIRTDRYECPCCNTDIAALVNVQCEGLMTKECDEVRGLYRISINASHGGCNVTVEKLTDTTPLWQGRCAYLPQKDYDADPKAKKEIEDRYKAIAEIAQQNPGRVAMVGGIETGDDLKNLISDTIRDMEKQD